MTNDTPSTGDPRFDPRHQHPGGQPSPGVGSGHADSERADRLSREDRFEDSLAQTWGAEDAAADRRLRSLIGPVTPLYAPPYGFERVVLRARRRRNRAVFVGLAAGFTAIAVATGGVVVGTGIGGTTVQTAGCDTVSRTAPGAQQAQHSGLMTGYGFRTGFGGAPAAAAQVWSGAGTYGIGAAASGAGSGRGVMDRKYEWAIGGVLTAAALSVGIVAGCSSSNSDNGPSASATESGAPTVSPSVGDVTLPAPSADQSGAAAQPTAKLPQCHTVDLSPAVTIVQGSQGAGHELMNIKLTNTSGHTCTVYGYPGMKLEDGNGAGQATTVTRNRAFQPKTLIVPNGGSVATTARFDFDIPAADEPQTGNCEAPSVYTQVTPPDETTQLSATITGGPVTVCEHGTLDVLPFISGAKGANQ